MAVEEIAKLTTLSLVHPPFSAQEATWYERANDPELEAVLRSSNVYMIGARADARFDSVAIEGGRADVTVVVGDGPSVSLHIEVEQLAGMALCTGDRYDVVGGEKMIQIVDPGANDELLDWFTIDKLAWDAAHGKPGLQDVIVPSELVEFDLLYVGIATDSDSFARVVERAHKAKGEILSNERQRSAGARVADEVFLFFLRADPLFLRRFHPEDIEEADFVYEPPPAEKIVEDLERAFISQLAPGYNRLRYKKYPKGSTGLAADGLARYGYVVAENLTFRTEAGIFRCGLDRRTGLPEGGDLLLIEGDNVAIVEGQVETAPTRRRRLIAPHS